MRYVMLVVLFLCTGFMPLGATAASPAMNQPKYTYTETSGKCTDQDGKQGYNKAPQPKEMFPTATQREYPRQNVECVDFTNFNFNLHIGYKGSRLIGWNFRGAKLDGAKFHFADIVDGDLAGTNMKGFTFGYTNIDGVVDDHTVLPASGCKVEKSKIHCRL